MLPEPPPPVKAGEGEGGPEDACYVNFKSGLS
jgi:hypothetical protein